MTESRSSRADATEAALLACIDGASLPASDLVRVDWSRLERLASRHSLVPLLHHHSAHGRFPGMPKAVFASLWARADAIGRRSRQMADEMVRVHRSAAAAGIRLLPYKGPTLALCAFGAVELREFGDLDFLVRRDDVLRTKRLLADSGYRPQFELPPDLETELLASHRHYEYPLMDAARGFLIELHWRPDPEVDLLPLADDAWWDRLPRVEVQGHPVPVLANGELLLVLALHGTKHLWQSLAWLADLARVAAGCTPGDWTHALDLAARNGCERRLALGLRLLRDLGGARLPAGCSRLVDDELVARLARLVEARAFEDIAQGGGAAEFVRINWSLERGKRSTWRYVARSIFEPGLGEWTRWHLPRGLRLLYYPLRLARLAGKYTARG
jgi:hypothetical protein